jgi:hypothetical protein
MWTHHIRLIKLKKPNLHFSYVRTFPFASESIKKLRDFYKIDELRRDPILLEINSLYEHDNGCDFIVLFLEDEIKKLTNFRKFKPEQIDNYFVPAVVYKCPFIYEHNGKRSFNPPNSERFEELFFYYFEYLKRTNVEIKGNTIIKYLFNTCVKYFLYKELMIFPEKIIFKLSNLIKKDVNVNYDNDEKYFREFLSNMKKEDIIKFIIFNFD